MKTMTISKKEEKNNCFYEQNNSSAHAFMERLQRETT